VLLVTHDAALARVCARRSVTLVDGRVTGSPDGGGQ
jgi:predicted ABC-type transport system involved in lysophospholipase L1 biosynthesis ATPase subunit